MFDMGVVGEPRQGGKTREVLLQSEGEPELGSTDNGSDVSE